MLGNFFPFVTFVEIVLQSIIAKKIFMMLRFVFHLRSPAVFKLYLALIMASCILPSAASESENEFIVSARYNINNGLSSNFLADVIQDSEGYLWIASDNGIIRFDGYSTVVYKPDYVKENTFNTIGFNCITEDKNGDLWFGSSSNGVNVFNKKTQTVKVFDRDGADAPALHENTINHIFSDSKGRVWISTVAGLNLYNPDTDEMIAYSSPSRAGKNDPFGTVSYVYQDSNGKILVGTWGNGLYVYDEELDQFEQLMVVQQIIEDEIVNRVFRIMEDSDGNYWLGTWEGGLLKVRLPNYQNVEIIQHYLIDSVSANNLSSNIVYSIYEAKNGDMWIGTPYGLNIISGHQGKQPKVDIIRSGSESGSISHNDVFRIYEDKSGIIWLATGGGGLNMVNPAFKRIEAYSFPTLIQYQENQVVRTFFVDDDSSLLIGVHGFGFGKFFPEEDRFISYTELPQYRNLPRNINAATCFHKDKAGNMWIGTRYEGLFLVRPGGSAETQQFMYSDPVTSDRSRVINTIYEDQFGSIWVGSGMGLFKFVASGKDGLFDIYRYLPGPDNLNSIKGEVVSSIMEDSNSNLWVGTVGGGISVARNIKDVHQPITFRHFLAAPDNTATLKSNIIYSIYEDKHNRIWIGTGTAGLALYDAQKNEFRHFRKETGFRDDTVYDIIEDDDNLWLTTNKGLFRFTMPEDQPPRLEIFTSEDGFQSDVFINNASYKCKDGRIFVGGYYGFNVFRPDQLFRNNYIPPVVISGIWVGDEPVNVYQAMEDGLVLRHNQNNISVAISALSFFQPHKNKYTFILEGLNDEWNSTSYEGRTVTFSHIPSGSYVLKFKGSNSSDVWNDQLVELNIKVKPHPLRSAWAYILYGVIILVVLIVIYVFLINNYRIKHAWEIEKLERKKEDNINQFKFRFFTNISHELLTPLSVLTFSIEDLTAKKLANSETLSIMDRNVKRIMHLITQLLDFRKVERGSMSPLVSPGNFAEFTEKITASLKPMAAKKNISIFQSGNITKKVFFDHDKVEKIFCNLLSNALKYTPQGGRILIRHDLVLKDQTEWMELEVTDSGKGIEPEKIDAVFERFYQVKSVTGRTFGVGIGLALAKSLVENHKGTITVKNEPGLGASFKVSIPVSPDSYDTGEVMHEESDYQHRNFIIFDPEESLLPNADEYQSDAFGAEIEINGHDQKKTILIVEDNSDFRLLLKEHLDNYYHTLEASNGEEGYELCIEKQPDLVITDMMMPVMSGIELCRKIKNNIETSHIVVIMLTAKISQEARHDSYLANADSYLSKPVDIRTLQTRVESLLKRMDSITRKFETGIMPTFEENTISTLDEELLNKIKSLIESKLMNTELNVLSLSQEIGMSKSNLYRKITKLTGMSPVEFIRYIRLQAAAGMIAKEGLNVSEAAYSCGFNDLSYFSKSFKKQFGSSPKKFQQQKEFSSHAGK
jgi:signal transduction histidine kinase/ligand-binding sensor domain-containing protein/DNA-binding response OmpR family regulator